MYFDSTGAAFVDWGIAVGLDDKGGWKRFGSRGLDLRCQACLFGQKFSDWPISLLGDKLVRIICFFHNNISLDLACSTLMYLLR